MRNTLILIGQGKMAQTMFDCFKQIAILEKIENPKVVLWKDKNSAFCEASVVLHVGSGRELKQGMDYCRDNHVPMIQASSGLDSIHYPKQYHFAFIEAPNLSLQIVKLFCLLRRSKDIFQEFEIKIEESHQSTKNTVPGTAIELARHLNVDSKQIISIRDQKLQKEKYFVPDEYLDGHAIHNIRVLGKGGCLTITTRILGRDAYAFGVASIMKVVDHLDDGRYSVSELVDRGLL